MQACDTLRDVKWLKSRDVSGFLLVPIVRVEKEWLVQTVHILGRSLVLWRYGRTNQVTGEEASTRWEGEGEGDSGGQRN